LPILKFTKSAKKDGRNMEKISTFFKEVHQELKIITWPKKPDISEGTTVVLTMTIITSIFLMLVDVVFNSLITKTLFN
jgi:preprotein translocase SecE subunit